MISDRTVLTGMLPSISRAMGKLLLRTGIKSQSKEGWHTEEGREHLRAINLVMAVVDRSVKV